MATTMPSLNPELVEALKRLRLGRIATSLPERLVLADKQEMAFDELLLLLLTDEISRRDNAAADNRAAQAGLEPSMRLELWDKTAKVTFDKRVLSELMSLRFLEAPSARLCSRDPSVSARRSSRMRSGQPRLSSRLQRDVRAGGRNASSTSSESLRQFARRRDDRAHPQSIS
jgi:hypothetical protein